MRLVGDMTWGRAYSLRVRRAGVSGPMYGTPKTELVCTCDFDETQFYQIYGNDSLIASLGLSPIETGRARIDYLFKIKNGEIPQISEPEAEYFCSASCISAGSMTKEETAKWLQDECNVTPKMD